MKTPLATSASLDLYGDEIPYGASVRLGTERFRVLPGYSRVVISEDANTVVSITSTGLRWLDSHTGRIRKEFDLGRFNVMTFAASPDRRSFAFMGYRYVGAKRLPGHIIQTWDIASAERIDEFRWDEDRNCRAMAYTPDGKHIVVGNGHGMLSVWDTTQHDWAVDHQLPGGSVVNAIAVSPDGQRIAAATSKNLFIWNWLRGVDTEEIGGFRRVTALAFADNNNMAIASARFDGGPEIVMFDLGRGKITREFRPPVMKSLRAAQLLFAPDRELLAVPNSQNLGGATNNAILVWNVETGKLVQRLQMENVRPIGVAFSPDQQLIAGISNSEIAVWDFETGRRHASNLVGHHGVTSSVRFAQNDSQIVTASDDGTARIWETSTGMPLGVMRHEKWVRAIAASADGKWLATSSLDDTVRLWNHDSMEDVYVLPGHGEHGGERVIAFTSDSSRLASWGDDTVLRVWDVKTGKTLLTEQIKPGGAVLLDDENGIRNIDDCVMAPDASKLLVSTYQRTYLFDVTTGKEIKTIPSENRIEAACFSADATQLLLARDVSNPLKAQDPQARPQPPKKYEFAMMSLNDRSIKWSYRVQGRNGPMALSADGKLVAVTARGADFDTLIFLDARSGKQLAAIDRINRIAWGSGQQSLAFSSDSTQFAACMPDTTVLVWQLSDLGL